MNAEHLLEAYEKISDAPDAVARLRRFVLNLAVRGKLVEQDAAAAPAAELLTEIASEKKFLVEQGVLKADRKPKKAPAPVKLFDLPLGWAWANLQSICLTVTDGDHQPPPRADEGVPFLVIGDVRTKTINYNVERKVSCEYFDDLDPIRKPRPGDILYTLVGSFGIPVPVRSDTPFCVQRHIGILRPAEQFNLEALALFLESEFAFKQAEAAATGIAQKTVSLAGLRGMLIPVPPLAEQHRIVAKVDELMALCDRLEEARKTREETRDKLTAASLARLTAPDTDPQDFPTHARFALEALPALTTRPDQIKTLRQTILNLAVRGKLVEQDPGDEPATDLLANASQRGKRSAGGTPVSEDDRPFELPSGWQWTRVQNTLMNAREISYGVIKLGPEPNDGGVHTLRCSDVRPGYIDRSGIRRVREDIEAEYVRTRLIGGEVLINIRGTLGGVAKVPTDLAGYNVAREVAVVPVSSTLNAEYIVYLMLSPFFWDHIQGNLRGIAYKGLNLGTLRSLPIPIPPLAEQHRIVAKVDALMALCDRLEAALTTADTTRTRLLDALLHEALEPAAEALEAAE